MQCDRVPIVAVGPSQGTIVDEDAREIGWVFQGLKHWSRLAQDEREIAFANHLIGEFDFELVIAKASDADHINHHHCALMFAALMIGHHFAISAACSIPSASGVSCSGGNSSWPRSPRRLRTVGSASALLAAALSFAITSRGVPFGAHSPRQPDI